MTIEEEQANKATPIESGVVITKVTTTTTAAPADVEAQKQAAAASAAANNDDGDADAGKGWGIACFVLLLVGIIFNFLFPLVSFICIIIVIVITSTISCGCCCGSTMDLKPHVKRWSTATLASLCLMFILQIIAFIGIAVAGGRDVMNTGTVSQRTAEGAGVGLTVVWALTIILNFCALIFSAIFTWGRDCCVPRA